jgi:serine/threonine-protein kinase
MAAAAADRNLLFGLLALQIGLIDQSKLVAAFQAWTLDKARSLADHLVAQGDLDSEQRALLEALAAQHLKKHGDAGESLAAIPAGRSTRDTLARLGDPDLGALIAQLAPGSTLAEAEDPDRTSSYSVGTATSDGQRFRILRPHARGGLGEVFVAVDGELHREVALKQILEQHADDPFSRERFVAEAEITGALEHPGVVPVYGLGVDASGRPYYAMRFIKGESLKAAISRFHEGSPHPDPLQPGAGGTPLAGSGRRPGEGASRDLGLRKLLRRFIDVCNAVDYAHSRGVIHRDLKPANIIVGRHGETLVVDWGLAKSVGRADPSVGEQTIAPSSSGSSETLPGSALGTPAYMSPEQAQGDLTRLGPRSDVYSLGATLYCLLTGKPPFEGEDAGAILNAVQEGQFPRPSRFDPTLDTALEAVCLKAMATAPEHRYQTPRELADDLDRWMADEPVTARKEPFSRRARRWELRHRTAVAAASVALVAGTVGLSVVAAVQTKANADLRDANERVEQRYALAVEAIKAFHTGVSEDFLLKEGQFKELRDRLLNSAADFYGKLGALLGKETDFSSRRALAQSNFELAELTGKVGRTEAALAAHRAVLAAREALATEPGADSGVKGEVGQSLTEVASLLYSTGKGDEALAAYRRSELLLASLASLDPASRAALAACRTRMAGLLLFAGKHAEALAACKLARADQEVLASAPAASNDARRDLADTIYMIGSLLWSAHKLTEAEPECRTALRIRQKLADDNPAVSEFRDSLARTHWVLGHVMWLTGKLSEAETDYRTALAIHEKLANDNPAVTPFRTNLASSHFTIGYLLPTLGKSAEAEVELRTALAMYEKLADDNPTDADIHRHLVTAHSILGTLLLQVGKPVDAEALCRAALAICEKQAHDNPTIFSFRGLLPFVLYNLGDVVRALGRAEAAKHYYERAIALAELRFHEDPMTEGNRYWLACSFRRRGQSLRDLGNLANGADDARQALALLHGLRTVSVPDLCETACCHALLAGLAGRAGSGVTASEGEAAAVKAMDHLRQVVANGYRNANELRIESALDALRSRDDFRLLMMDVAFPTEPFAVAR